MNMVIQTSQPAPKLFSLSSRIIAITSMVVATTLIVALIFQCVKSWHINFIGDFTLIACALAHLCWVLSTVNMLRQDVSKWLIRMNQTALITPNAVIVMVIVAMWFADLICPDLRYTKAKQELMSGLLYIFAFTPPIIVWITNTVTVICSMIKVHKYLKS